MSQVAQKFSANRGCPRCPRACGSIVVPATRSRSAPQLVITPSALSKPTNRCRPRGNNYDCCRRSFHLSQLSRRHQTQFICYPQLVQPTWLWRLSTCCDGSQGAPARAWCMALSCCCCCVASCHTQSTLPPWGQASVWIPLHPPPSHPTPMVEVASSSVHKSNQPESYRCWFVQRLPTGPEHAQRIKTLWGKLEPK